MDLFFCEPIDPELSKEAKRLADLLFLCVGDMVLLGKLGQSWFCRSWFACGGFAFGRL